MMPSDPPTRPQPPEPEPGTEPEPQDNEDGDESDGDGDGEPQRDPGVTEAAAEAQPPAEPPASPTAAVAPMVLAVVGDRVLSFPTVLAAVQSHAVGLASHIFTGPGQFYQLGRLRYVEKFFADAPELTGPVSQNTPEHLQALWAHLQAKAVPGMTASRALGSEGETDMAGKKKDKAPKAPSNGDGRRNKNSDKRITVLAEGNPKREGTATYQRFKLYKDGMTVADFIKKGGTSADVSYDVEHKFISLSD
jgi:hypothetical protein